MDPYTRKDLAERNCCATVSITAYAICMTMLDTNVPEVSAEAASIVPRGVTFDLLGTSVLVCVASLYHDGYSDQQEEKGAASGSVRGFLAFVAMCTCTFISRAPLVSLIS